MWCMLAVGMKRGCPHMSPRTDQFPGMWQPRLVGAPLSQNASGQSFPALREHRVGEIGEFGRKVQASSAHGATPAGSYALYLGAPDANSLASSQRAEINDVALPNCRRQSPCDDHSALSLDLAVSSPHDPNDLWFELLGDAAALVVADQDRSVAASNDQFSDRRLPLTIDVAQAGATGYT